MSIIIDGHMKAQLIKLCDNLNLDEYHINGGIADYFNLKGVKLNVYIHAGDIDISIASKDVLRKMERIIGVKAQHNKDFIENKFIHANEFEGESKISQYSFPNTSFDVYLYHNKEWYNKIETKVSTLNNVKVRYLASKYTYLQTVNSFNYNYDVTKDKERMFKHLKKMVVLNNVSSEISSSK